MEERWVTVDGAQQYVAYRKGGKHAVMITHGLNSDVRELGDLPESLHDAGFSVYAFDQRGFGKSEGERGRVDLARFTKTADAVLAMAREDGCKTVLGIGHSLGGSLMIGYAARGALQGVVAAHPPRNIWEELNPAEKAYYSLRGRAGNKRMARGLHPGYAPYTVRPKHMVVEQKIADVIRDMDFIQRKTNLGNYDFARTMHAQQWARRLHCPVAMVTSEQDRVVSPENTLKIMESIKSPLTQIEHVGGHSCFLDLDKHLVIDEIVHWCQEQT